MIIQPETIRTKALRLYKVILASSVCGTPEFPVFILFGKVKAKDTLDNFPLIRDQIEVLIDESKENKGYGYTVEFIQRNDQKIGTQSFPDKIFFETLDDYLKFFRKENEYKRFLRVVQKLTDDLPQLLPWIKSHPMKILDNIGKWDDIIKVCKYFLANPQPNIYIREIPLDISTKFIEDNTAIIKPLLDILIEDFVNKDESYFNKRYNLKYDEPLIRLRILDPETAQSLFSGIDDLSIPQGQFNQLDIPCKRVFILENKTNVLNFLTLPSMKDSIAIFGKGFGVGTLKGAEWLTEKQIIYWGDIDPHGFQILSQIRGYFPQTQSCMMDLDTFREFEDLVVTGACTDVTELEHLTPEEHLLFNHLCGLETNNRLEQEKITQKYALEKISKLSYN
ncbi:Wadjet anti-phage system protein JetD domain-containing protein [Methanolobus sp. WCC1]|uniref:Wadjet anti-phage system protein JetD domain-containing protein n=1 Tax=unclassified Methanolobus TaxID=2629569 RepID=UPI003248CED5